MKLCDEQAPTIMIAGELRSITQTTVMLERLHQACSSGAGANLILMVPAPQDARRPFADWHEAAFRAVDERRLSDGEPISVACSAVYDAMALDKTKNVRALSFLKMYRRYLHDEIRAQFVSSIINGNIDIALEHLELCSREFQQYIIEKFDDN